MSTPEQILAKHGYPMPGDDLDSNLVKAMEEYKNQFIDFDGPIAMVDHYDRLARNWEDAHAHLEEKLRTQYDAELDAAIEKNQKLNVTIERLENDLSDGVKILETIWLAFDRDYLMKGLLSADYENLKNYLGK
jgi:hypothetical protein